MDFKTRYSTVVQPPPGPAISRPTASNPRPLSNTPTFNDAMHVRNTVFVDEQGCSAEMEFEDDDARSWHWVIYDNGNGEVNGSDKPKTPVGTIRLVLPPQPPHENNHEHGNNGEEQKGGSNGVHGDEEHYVRVTRVAILPAYRGIGLGRVLVETALKWASEHPQDVVAEFGPEDRWDGLTLVHAQVVVEAMYARLGFVTDTSMGQWLEEGMLHVGMWQKIKVLSQKTS